MDVIPPLRSAQFAIDASMLTATTVAEPSVGETAWTTGATFAERDQVILGAPSHTATVTIASPAVVTWTAHGLPDGTQVTWATTGALPTGLTAGRIYYVVNSQADTFRLSAEVGGRPLVTTGSQSGTHTATAQIHRTYESVGAGNTGHPPAIDDGTNWIDVGPTNRWAMFDLLRNTQSVGASPMVVTLTPGERVDAIGVVGLVADSITVEVKVAGVTVYTYTRQLLTRPTTTWKGYFFGRFRQAAAIGRLDLPPYTAGQIVLTMTRATGDVSCGGVVMGQHIYIGDVAYNPEIAAENFSKITSDEDGKTELQRKRSVPATTQTLRCTKAMVDTIVQAHEDLDATPALWMALDDPGDGYFRALLILGVYTLWTINLDLPDYAQQQLQLREV